MASCYPHLQSPVRHTRNVEVIAPNYGERILIFSLCQLWRLDCGATDVDLAIAKTAVKEIDAAEEPVHKRRCRIRIQLVRTSLLLDPTVVHDYDCVRNLQRLFPIVRHENRCYLKLVL